MGVCSWGMLTLVLSSIEGLCPLGPARGLYRPPQSPGHLAFRFLTLDLHVGYPLHHMRSLPSPETGYPTDLRFERQKWTKHAVTVISWPRGPTLRDSPPRGGRSQGPRHCLRATGLGGGAVSPGTTPGSPLVTTVQGQHGLRDPHGPPGRSGGLLLQRAPFRGLRAALSGQSRDVHMPSSPRPWFLHNR